MSIERWNPSRTYTRQEEALLKSLRRTRKLFAFLRDHRHELFDDEMQDGLEAMYRDTADEAEVRPPVLMRRELHTGRVHRRRDRQSAGLADARGVIGQVAVEHRPSLLDCKFDGLSANGRG